MKIKVDMKNATAVAKLTAALEEAQGKATARTLDAEKIAHILGKVEKEIGIAKAALKGTTVRYDGAQQFPQAYKYTPDSTWFEAEYNGSAWYITKLYRYTCPNRCTSNTQVCLSDTAKAKLIEKYSSMVL